MKIAVALLRPSRVALGVEAQGETLQAAPGHNLNLTTRETIILSTTINQIHGYFIRVRVILITTLKDLT